MVLGSYTPDWKRAARMVLACGYMWVQNVVQRVWFWKSWLGSRRSGNVESGNQRIILVSHDAHRMGAQLNALEMCRTLVCDMHLDVVVVLWGPGVLKKSFQELAKVYDLSGFKRSTRYVRLFARNLRLQGYQKALVNSTASGKIIPYLAKNGIYCLALVHEMPDLIRSKQLEVEAQLVSRDADRVVFPHQLVYERFDELVPIGLEKVLILPQGLYKRNRWRSQRSKARRILKSRLGLSDSSLLVLGAGFGDFRKGIDLFFGLGKFQLGLEQEIRFIWAGHIEDQFKEQASVFKEDEKDSNLFVLPGFLEEIDIYFAAADIFVLTSREDPFPAVVQEALDSGVPVIAFEESGGAAAMIVEAAAGLVVPMEDLVAFDQALQFLVEHPEIRHQMGMNGQAFVEANLSFRTYVVRLSTELGIA